MLEKTKTKAKAEAPEVMAPPTIQVARAKLTVVGIKPLLTHSPLGMGADAGAKRGSRIPEPEDEAEAGCYRLADGGCALPGEAFRRSYLAAGGAWKAAKRSTMKGILAHTVVVEELVPLLHLDGTPIKDYAIDRRRVIVQGSGVIRARPRFEIWMARFTIEYDPVLLREPAILREIVNDAGNRIGVGDYRPYGPKGSAGGPFGRYQVTDFALEE